MEISVSPSNEALGLSRNAYITSFTYAKFLYSDFKWLYISASKFNRYSYTKELFRKRRDISKAIIISSVLLITYHGSACSYRDVSHPEGFLEPAIKGTAEMLQAVKTNAPEVRRLIYTSSCAAVMDFNARIGTTPPRVYTEEDWNLVTHKEALSYSKNVFTAYWANKKYAELSVFKFVEEGKPNFDVVTLCAPAIYGPLRHSITNTNELNETTWRIYKNYINSSKDAPLPPDRVFMYVDVRDIAAAHVLAATTPKAGNERIIVAAGAASSQRIADILREIFPELERRTPAGKPGTNSLPENHFTISNEKSMKILGLKYREEEDTFVDMVRQILEIEKGQKGDWMKIGGRLEHVLPLDYHRSKANPNSCLACFFLPLQRKG
jgi:nucleoside-diphosphate-sugar epimerase